MRKHFENKVKRQDLNFKDQLTPKYRIRVVGSKDEYKRRDKHTNEFRKLYF